jgi:hypothetical protein
MSQHRAEHCIGGKGPRGPGRWTAAALALCAAMLGPLVCLADEGASGQAAAPGDAELAAQALGAKKYDLARQLYARAYERQPAAQTLLGLALSEYYSEHLVESATHFRQYLARADAATDKLALVHAWIDGVEARIVRLEIHVPAGAQVSVDGTPVARDSSHESRISIDILPGSHEVVAHRGTNSQVRYVAAQGGQQLDVEFPPDAESAGVGTTPPEQFASWPAAPPTSAQPTGSSAKWATTIALGSLGLVSAAIAAGFAFDFGQKGADADRLRTAVGAAGCGPASPSSADCAALHEKLNAQSTSGGLATGFSIGAGVAAAGALGALLLWPSNPRSASRGWRTAPWLGAGQAGFVVSRPW